MEGRKARKEKQKQMPYDAVDTLMDPDNGNFNKDNIMNCILRKNTLATRQIMDWKGTNKEVRNKEETTAVTQKRQEDVLALWQQ